MAPTQRFFSYFPQFHADPLNDRAWGAGFTDWDLIRELPEPQRAAFTPAIGHYNPSDAMYLPQLIEQLAGLPFDAGLMVYHYHFDGIYALSGFERQLLEQRSMPPFFFCWANESWTKRWIGKPGDVIAEQTHRPDRDGIAAHAAYLARFFGMPGYHKVDGRPLLLIYNAQASPNLPRALGYYREAFLALGHQPLIGACVSHPQPVDQLEPYDFGCEFQPRFFFNCRSPSVLSRTASRIKARYPSVFEWLGAQRDRLRERNGSRNFQYAHYLAALADGSMKEELRRSVGSLPLMRSTFFSWDNTPRYRQRSTVVSQSDVDSGALWPLAEVRSDGALPLLINSWNEWSEGAALEPGVVTNPLRDAFLKALARP